ncbi:hypothetical protein Q1695_012256 [Nippostrongylus brasiliensis]|nr:hypothetical protein Q1695_012256 [Nippostrongylus brasiliensis]
MTFGVENPSDTPNESSSSADHAYQSSVTCARCNRSPFSSHLSENRRPIFRFSLSTMLSSQSVLISTLLLVICTSLSQSARDPEVQRLRSILINRRSVPNSDVVSDLRGGIQDGRLRFGKRYSVQYIPIEMIEELESQ